MRLACPAQKKKKKTILFRLINYLGGINGITKYFRVGVKSEDKTSAKEFYKRISCLVRMVYSHCFDKIDRCYPGIVGAGILGDAPNGLGQSARCDNRGERLCPEIMRVDGHLCFIEY